MLRERDLGQLTDLPALHGPNPDMFVRFPPSASLSAAIDRRLKPSPVAGEPDSPIIFTPAQARTELHDPSRINPEITQLAADTTAAAGRFEPKLVNSRFSDDDFFAAVAIGNALQDRINSLEDGAQTLPASEFSRLIYLSLGCELVARNISNWQLGLATESRQGETFGRIKELREITHARSTMLQIDDTTLADLAGFNSHRDSPVSFFRFLTKAYLANIRNFEDIFSENQKSPKDQYPNLVGQAIAGLPARIMGLVVPDNTSFVRARIPGENPIFTQIEVQAQKLHDAVRTVIRSCYNLLLHPDASPPNFAALKAVLEPSLKGQREDKLTAFYMLGLYYPDKIYELYRRAQAFIRSGREEGFYGLLAEAVGDYIEEIPDDGYTILTKDDIAAIADSADMGNAQPVTTIESLRPQVENIVKTSRHRIYDINPEKINWGALATPSKARIVFDSNQPRKFTIYLLFGNSEGESTEVNWTVDITKRTFDWNLIEDPEAADDPEVALLKEHFFIVSRTVLAEVTQQAIIQAAQVIRRPVVVQTNGTSKIRPVGHVADPVYALRKEARRSHQLTATARPFVLSRNPFSEEKNRGRIHIVLSDIDPGLFARVSPQDREIILGAIAEFNERRTGGRFTRRRTPGPDGLPRYTLRVGCTAPKGARILLEEVTSQNGTREFVIETVGYRKDVYRNL